MGQIVTQSLPANLLVILTDANGLPATGISFSAVSCQFRREGEVAFNPKVLTALNFIELGNGFYQITFDAADLSVVGSFAYVVFGAAVQQFSNEAQIRSAASLIPTIPTALPMCDLTGNINDLSGNPIEGAAVSARVIGMPTILSNVVGVTDDLVTATTDENGVFFLSLARLAVVDIFIPQINYRRQVTVPNLSSTNLFSGIA